jgi:hypothetical protein
LGVGAICSDDHVVITVAIDITRSAYRDAGVVVDATPLILKPLLPFRDERFRFAAKPIALPKTTKLAPELGRWDRSRSADNQVSKPIAIDVAAPLTRPALSYSATPLSLKPLLPSRVERFKLEANPPALPKTT